jgi:hypothetical protein
VPPCCVPKSQATNLGPIFGPQNGPHSFPSVPARFAQAAAVWNWVAYLRTRNTKPLLLLNLDETGVPLFNGDRAGTLLQAAPPVLRTTQTGELEQFATTHETRGQATHIAMICDDPALQPHLPQVLVGPSNLLTVGVTRDLQDHLSTDNVAAATLRCWPFPAL